MKQSPYSCRSTFSKRNYSSFLNAIRPSPFLPTPCASHAFTNSSCNDASLRQGYRPQCPQFACARSGKKPSGIGWRCQTLLLLSSKARDHSCLRSGGTCQPHSSSRRRMRTRWRRSSGPSPLTNPSRLCRMAKLLMKWMSPACVGISSWVAFAMLSMASRASTWRADRVGR
jgi:hypothetical protein